VLARQAGCEATDNDDNTALHRAAQRGHEKAAAILADNYANLEPKNKDQKTPFQVAAENEHEEVAWLFLQKRELQSHHESMALFLIQKCPILHKKNELLLWAANAGYADVVQGLLLEKGADVDAKADGGLNPLLIAVMKQQTAVVQVLLEQGADVHVKDPAGRTPLMVAYVRQNNAISQLLKSYMLPKPQ
jgi:ankyrin repeat protein